MSKFGKKLILWLTVIVLVLGGISLSITTVGLEKYYLATQKAGIQRIYEKVRALPIETVWQKAHTIGRENQVMLLTVPWTEDNERLNERIINAFKGQGVIIQKLWLWEEDAQKLEEGKVVNTLYNQGDSGYSVFMKYYLEQGTLVMMSRTIPHIDKVLKVINLFIMIVWLLALGTMIVCIIFYIRRMTKPLVEMERLVKAISELEFRHMHLCTGDELESLAKGINTMSDSLQRSHGQLEEKNHQMKELLANVSHELKTPIALIKAYGIAIEEGMDDGTFLTTMLQQNEVMERMVNKLLMLAKKEKQLANPTEISPVEIIKGYLRDYEVYSDDVAISTQLEKVGTVWADEEAVRCAIGNFLSNAIKYTSDGKVKVSCYEDGDEVYVEVRNGMTEKGKAAIDKLWEPFYVAEASRNKALCGTGLGLYMTRRLLKKVKIAHGCRLEENNIIFYIQLKKVKDG